MKIVDILPTRLGAVMYPEHDEIKSLIISEIDNHSEHRRDAPLEHVDYYSPLLDTKFTKFREWIEQQAEIYARDILEYDVNDLIVTDSWINICNGGGYQHPHFHINSFVCALYYVSFDDNLHAPTYFYKPNDSQRFPDYLSMMLTNHTETKYNQPNGLVGIEGSLILWQSNTVHGYMMNNNDNRITISTNIMPKSLGTYHIVPLNKDERHTQMITQRSGQLWDSPKFI